MLNDLQSVSDNLVVIDAGDMLFKVPRPREINKEAAPSKMDLLIRAYNEIGYDAYNIGINDLALGTDFLREFESRAQFPFISANIVDDDGKPIFTPYTIIKRNGAKIGIVGVTTGNSHVDGVSYKPVLEAARELQQVLRHKTDILILMASVFNPDAKAIQDSDLEYDLIFRTHTSRFSRYATEMNTGYYIETGKEGKYLHFVTVHQEVPSASLVNVSRENQRLDFIERRLKELQGTSGDKSLEEVYADNQPTLDFIHNLQDQKTELQNKIEASKNYMAIEVQSLGKSIQDSPKWLEEVKQFNSFYNSLETQ